MLKSIEPIGVGFKSGYKLDFLYTEYTSTSSQHRYDTSTKFGPTNPCHVPKTLAPLIPRNMPGLVACAYIKQLEAHKRHQILQTNVIIFYFKTYNNLN